MINREDMLEMTRRMTPARTSITRMWSARFPGITGEPECGFLFPAFTDWCGDLDHVNVYQKNPARPHMELVREILGAFVLR